MRTLKLVAILVTVQLSAITFAKKEKNIAREKNLQAWNSLRQFVQPLGTVTAVGAFLKMMHNSRIFTGGADHLEVAVSAPFAALALASCVNFGEKDFEEALSNYKYFVSKGLLISAATVAAGPSEVGFKMLNDGWFKDVFTGNVLHSKYGFGVRMMIFFHTFDLFANDKIAKWAYENRNKPLEETRGFESEED